MIFRKREVVAPNFLSNYDFASPKAELSVGAFFGFLFLSLAFLFPFQQFQQLGLALLAFVVFSATMVKIEWGVYALGFLSFFHGWDIAFSDYSFTKNLALLNSLNGPLIDFVAVVLFPCALLALLIKRLPKKYSWFHLFFPALLYACFLAVAWFSAQQASVLDPSQSIKYFGRPLVFVFLAFVLLPHFFIHSEKIFHRFLQIWFWVGVAIALFGFSSLFVVQQSGWLRIQPYGIGSFAPLGVNHNLIAEALIALIPIGFWWFLEQKKKKEQAQGGEYAKHFSVYFFGTGFMILVALGTLSRAAWVSFFVQTVALLFLFREQRTWIFQKVRKFAEVFFLLGAIFLLYMGFFLNSNVVSSSNSSRVEVTKIVAFFVERSPWIGFGPGSFVPLLQEVSVHTVEFGEALDAHGFIQKILVEEGVIGFVLFGLFLLSVLGVLFWSQHKHGDALSKVLFVMVLGAIVFQLFNTSYFNSVMWMPIGIALVWVGLRRVSGDESGNMSEKL